ncbi:unnamed protein product [Malus baccata var. baccata]
MASHTISPGQSLFEAQTITSPSGTFELGFFRPDAFDSYVVIWQSFDHMLDSWLPAAELGYNNHTKRKLVLTSWRNLQNLAPGPFSFELDEFPFNLSDYTDAFIRGTLKVNGQLTFYAWYQDFWGWDPISTEPSDQCEYPHCRCLEGFEPKVGENWRLHEFSDGCVRKIPFHCSPGDSFLAITGVPYQQNFKEIFHVSIEQCRLEWDLNNIRITQPFALHFIGYSPDSTVWHLQIVDSKNEMTRKTTWIVIGVLARICSILSSTFIVTIFFRKRWSVGALVTTGDSLVPYKHRDLRRATKNFFQKLGE